MKYKEKKKNNKGSDDSEDNYDEDFMLDEQDSKKNKRKMEGRNIIFIIGIWQFWHANDIFALLGIKQLPFLKYLNFK